MTTKHILDKLPCEQLLPVNLQGFNVQRILGPKPSEDYLIKWWHILISLGWMMKVNKVRLMNMCSVKDMHESDPSPGHKAHMQKHAVKELFGVI